MKKKIRVAVLFGGRSAEHEVSLRSARTVVSALSPDKYDIQLIGIDRQGRWIADSDKKMIAGTQVQLSSATSKNELQSLQPTQMIPSASKESSQKIDVIFPVLHGPYGEDGTIQGLAKLANIPCVGAGVLGSAIGMDKDVMKRLLKDAGIAIAASITVRAPEQKKVSFESVKKKLGMPVFVKPANMGSSVGVSKAENKKEFEQAVSTAFKFDRKIIIEEAIIGKEIECSVLGNDSPTASLPGEIIANDAFYSYQSKYSGTSKSEIQIPANMSEKDIKKIQQTAVKAYIALECRGMARVDFFLTDDGTCYVNEINTIPGFTSISMYPKMWEASGLPLTQLVDQLIELAIEDFEQQKALLTSPE